MKRFILAAALAATAVAGVAAVSKPADARGCWVRTYDGWVYVCRRGY
jgi:hypothetical protein